MFSQFFGNYLLEKQLITREQLKEVLEVHHATRLKIGVLAVNSGFMNAEDIDTVHAQQALVDKKFGELAIDMGFLTKEQLDVILSTQKKEHLLMGQTMIDMSIMTLKQFEEALEKYKEENKLSNEQFKALQDNNVEKIVEAFLNFGTSDDNKFYQEYVVLLINNLVRFICSGIRIKGFRKEHAYAVEWGAYQQVLGTKTLFTSAFMKEEQFVKLAEIYSKEVCDGPDELAQDSVAEFMNLQNGIFLVNSSNNGIELEMEPPQPRKNVVVEFSGIAYVVSLELEFGDIDFVISPERPLVREA